MGLQVVDLIGAKVGKFVKWVSHAKTQRRKEVWAGAASSLRQNEADVDGLGRRGCRRMSCAIRSQCACWRLPTTGIARRLGDSGAGVAQVNAVVAEILSGGR